MQLIFENLDTAYTTEAIKEARRNMLRASYFAGCAFTKSYVGYVHAVAHSLGGQYNVPHGLANAVLLPYVLEAYGKTIYKKLAVLAVAAGVASKETPEEEAALNFIQAVKDMKARFRNRRYHPGNSRRRHSEACPTMRTKRRIRCIRYRY